MKVIANKLKLSKSEWLKIGSEAGWTKVASESSALERAASRVRSYGHIAQEYNFKANGQKYKVIIISEKSEIYTYDHYFIDEEGNIKKANLPYSSLLSKSEAKVYAEKYLEANERIDKQSLWEEEIKPKLFKIFTEQSETNMEEEATDDFQDFVLKARKEGIENAKVIKGLEEFYKLSTRQAIEVIRSI